MLGVEGFVACGLLRGHGGVEFAGGDLFGRGSDETELAGSKVAFGSAHGGSEGAADDGSMLVEIAGSGGGIEDGAGFGVAKAVFGFIREELGVFVVFFEDAGGAISGKERIEAGEGFGDARADAVRSLRVPLL